MGDHVGIPGVVLLLLLLLPFILASAHAPADNTMHYILHYCTYYPHLSFLLLGLSVSSKVWWPNCASLEIDVCRDEEAGSGCVVEDCIAGAYEALYPMVVKVKGRMKEVSKS